MIFYGKTGGVVGVPLITTQGSEPTPKCIINSKHLMGHIRIKPELGVWGALGGHPTTVMLPPLIVSFVNGIVHDSFVCV